MENTENNFSIIEQGSKNSFQVTASPLFGEDDLFAAESLGSTLPKIDELSVAVSSGEDNWDYSVFPRNIYSVNQPSHLDLAELDQTFSSSNDKLTGALIGDISVERYDWYQQAASSIDYSADGETSSKKTFYLGLRQAIVSLIELETSDNFSSVIEDSFGENADHDLARQELLRIDDHELSALKQEDDSATVTIGGEILEIEQAEDISLDNDTASIAGTLQANDLLHPAGTGKYYDDYQLTELNAGDNLIIDLTSS